MGNHTAQLGVKQLPGRLSLVNLLVVLILSRLNLIKAQALVMPDRLNLGNLCRYVVIYGQGYRSKFKVTIREFDNSDDICIPRNLQNKMDKI